MRIGFALLAAACAGFATPVFAQAGQRDPCATIQFPDDLHFERNRSDLTPDTLASLKYIIERVTRDKCAIAQIDISGHIDASEDADPALALDMKRAEAAAKALTEAGLPAATMKMTAKGKSDPFSTRRDGSPEPKNQRAHVLIAFEGARAAIAERAERDAKAAAIAEALRDPSRCGSPAPAGFVCAVLIYEDARTDDASVAESARAAPMMQQVTKVSPPGRSTLGDALVPGMCRARMLTPASLFYFILTVQYQNGTADFPMRYKGLLGRAENDALDANDPRHVDPDAFKLKTCSK